MEGQLPSRQTAAATLRTTDSALVALSAQLEGSLLRIQPPLVSVAGKRPELFLLNHHLVFDRLTSSWASADGLLEFVRSTLTQEDTRRAVDPNRMHSYRLTTGDIAVLQAALKPGAPHFATYLHDSLCSDVLAVSTPLLLIRTSSLERSLLRCK
jgi:hypothetical protein